MKVAEIMPGDIIRVNCVSYNYRSPLIFPFAESDCSSYTSIQFFYVLILFEHKQECGAVVIPCIKWEECVKTNTHQRVSIHESSRVEMLNKVAMTMKANVDDVKVLKLAKSCQRVNLQHRCRPSCVLFSKDSATPPLHCEHPINSQFYIQTREDGFPPRAA